jgi:hypothetical protein
MRPERDRSPGAKRALQALNIIAVVATIGFGILSTTMPFFGNTQADVADRYPNLFVPAGLTFSIWSVIYVLIVVFAVYQARDLLGSEEIPMPFLQRVGPWFALATLGNIGWLFAFQSGRVALSMLPIVWLLLGLIVAYVRLGVGRKEASTGERLAVFLPFSLYLGWVSIAVIANTATTLVYLGWRGEPLPEAFWTVLMIGAGAVLALLALFVRGDLFFMLAVAWAFGGIILERTRAGDAPSVVAAAVAAVVLLAAGAAWAIGTRGLYRARRPRS